MFPSTQLKTEYASISEDKVRSVIKNIMAITLQCSCCLGFHGSVRWNSLDVVAYAICKQVKHAQRFKFKIDDFDEAVARMVITSTAKLTYTPLHMLLRTQRKNRKT